MNHHFPQWTSEITDTSVDGEDQLGIEGAAQGYQQEILPGIITVTDHARYYSFYAWILYRYIFSPDSSRLIKDFRGAFYKRHEMALILAGYLHHKNGKPFPGIIGSGTNNNKVARYWGSDEISPLDHDYFKNKEGGFGQYYRTAMRVMGIIEEPEEARLVYRLTERGKALAEAYQESIANTQYFKELEEKGLPSQIDRLAADEYAQVGCICPVAISRGKDHPLLLDTFFRFDEPQSKDNPHVRRRNSLGVALDLVHHSNGQFTRDQLRPALYIGEYSPGYPYQPTDRILEWVQRWQMVEARHMFTFGLQCLWAPFLLELKTRLYIRRADWWAWVEKQLDDIQWNVSFPHLAQKLCTEAGISGDFEQLLKITHMQFGLRSGLDEYSLYLKATRNQTNPNLLFQIGVRILIQFYLRFFRTNNRHGQIWKELADRPRIPLSEYFHYMDDGLQNENWLAREWLGRLYQEYIFEQHEMIALEKLRYQDYDTFKFYYEDEIFYLPTGKKPYQEPIRLAGNRLNNCITMLVDLGLIIENDQNVLTLSSEGEAYHARVLHALKNDNQP